MSDLTPFVGVWEGPTGTLTLLDHGSKVLIHQRAVTPQGPLSDALVAPLDGTPVAHGGGEATVRLEAGVLVFESVAAGQRIRIERQITDEGLVQTVQIADQKASVLFQRSSTKQVMVYRRDLKMRKGKIAAQCAHGSMAVFFRRDQGEPGRLVIPVDGPMEHWSRARFAKIVLSVDDEAGLLAIHEAAVAAGLPTAVITDAGKTEFHGVPTRTVVAVGPAALQEIDRITGPNGKVACKLA